MNGDRGDDEAGTPYVPRRPARRGELATREGRHACTRWGPESDDPILVLHGWMDHGGAFQLLADALPDDWPLLAIDWLGHGRSERRAGRYWFADRLPELDALLPAIYGDRPARIIGHSMGGTVALMHAGIRPTRTRWLVDIEGYGLPDRPDADLPARARDWLDALAGGRRARRYRDVAQLAAALRLRNPRLPAPHALFLAAEWTRPLADGSLEMLSDPYAELPAPMRFHRGEIEACWEQVRAPVLLLDGGESEFLARLGGEAALARWLQRHPFLRAATIPASGHLLPHERPAEVAAAVLAFAGADGAGPPATP